MAESRVDRRPAAAAVVAAALVVSSLLYPAAIAAPVASSTEAMDEVVVSGEQPGPGLWKVTKGNHTLWILGTLTPLPQKMTWRSREVEKVVAASNEVIGQESVSPNIGFFRGISLLPSLLRARYNPNGATLKDVLPAPLYARWSRLKAQYIGNDSGIERWRPMFAAIRLYSRALENSGGSRRRVSCGRLSARRQSRTASVSPT